MSLQIKKLHVAVEEESIIKNLNLTIQKGEIHVIMGPNGSGKSTLANAMMGHPTYTVTSGNIVLDDKEITTIDPNERAKAGLFLSMQYPPEIAGVSITNFLRTAVSNITGEKQHPIHFYKYLTKLMGELGIDPAFANRSVNVGFSGGEKKRSEILQLRVLNPTYAILDETDSGLDVDALQIVAKGINSFHSEKNGILLITHYNRILEYITPDVVHIMVDGTIVESGDKKLAEKIESKGYAAYQ